MPLVEPAPGPVRTTPPYADAGRILGAQAGTVAMSGACARAFPELAPSIEQALAAWRWRNDALAVEVNDAMWRAVQAQGADAGEIAAASRALAGELARIRAEVADGFDRWAPARKRGLCGTWAERLAVGDEDLSRRYPHELKRWHPAMR